MGMTPGLIAYGNVFDLDGPNGATEFARVLNYSHIIIGEGAYASESAGLGEHTPGTAGHITVAGLEHIRANALKYFNPYWRDGYSGGIWFPGPGDIGLPDITFGASNTRHAYRMTNRHMERLLGWCEAAMADSTYPCKGVFIDDFGYGQTSSPGGSGDPLLVFGAFNGEPGYPTDDWNRVRTLLFQQRLWALELALGKYILFNGCDEINGTGPTKAMGVRRMWEGYMKRYTRAELQAGCNPGDWIVVNGRTITANDTLGWYEVAEGDDETGQGAEIGDSYAPGGTNSIMDQAMEDAEELDLVLAVTFNENAPRGTYTYNGALFGSGAALIDDIAGWTA